MPLMTERPAISPADYFKAKLSYEITPWTLNLSLSKGEYLVLDVRDAEKFGQEHIPGALNVPIAQLPARLNELPRNKTIVPYCGNLICGLGVRASLQLAEKGYPVQLLTGGIEAWKTSFPVEGTLAKTAVKKTAKRK